MTGYSAEARWRAPVTALVTGLFVLRLLYASQVELLPEETYYWNYSRHLDIGYLDHPPMVAWLIRCGTMLFGNTEIGVRFGALTCGAVATFFVHRLTRQLFGEPAALISLVIVQFLPFFFLAGVLMTPDAPLTAAWAAALYFLERALNGGRPCAWLLAGLAIGLGLVSKYTIVLLGVSAFAFMLVDPASRIWLRRWPPYAALAVALLVFSPVILWNAEHEWASFAFQTSRRLAEAPRFSLHKLLGSAIVLLTPVGLWAAAAALLAVERGNRAARLLRLAVLVPLSVFALFSLRHEVKLDWTGAPWTAVLPLVAARWAGARVADPSAGRRVRAAGAAAGALLMLLYVTGLLYLTRGIPGMAYSSHTELLPITWHDFGRQIEAIAAPLRARAGGRFRVVGMDRYAIASELAFYGGDQHTAVAETSSAHLFGDMGLMYERWFPPYEQAGCTLLLVSWDPASLSAAHLADRVGVLEPIAEGVLTRGGQVVRRFYYRVARDYRYP